MAKGYVDEIKTAENYIADALPMVEMLIRQVEKSEGDYDSLKFIRNIAYSIQDILKKAIEE